MSKIPTKPCSPGMVKPVALAMMYGITIYERGPFGSNEAFSYTLRYRNAGWNVPSSEYGYFGSPSGGHMAIGPDGPTLEQWTMLFRSLTEKNTGWEWDGTTRPLITHELVLPEDYHEDHTG